VQMLVWYPASVEAGAKRMQYRDYVHLLTRELRFDKLTAEENRQSEDQYIGVRVSGQRYERKALEQLMGYATAAVADAPGAKGSTRWWSTRRVGRKRLREFDPVRVPRKPRLRGGRHPEHGTYTRAPSVDLVALDRTRATSSSRSGPCTRFRRRREECRAGGVQHGGKRQHARPDDQPQHPRRRVPGHRPAVPRVHGTAVQQCGRVGQGRPARAANLLYSQCAGIDREFDKGIRYAEVYTLFAGKDFFRHNDYIADGMLAGAVPGLFPENAADRKALYETVCLYTLNFLNGHLKKDTRGSSS